MRSRYGRRAFRASPIRCVGERIKATGVPEFREVAWRAWSLTQIHERLDQLFPDQIELTDLFDYPSISALASFLEQSTATQEA